MRLRTALGEILTLTAVASAAVAQNLPQTPGPKNAITDVPGIEVGHHTVTNGAGGMTGTTVIVARGASIRVRELPPEVAVKTHDGSPTESLDLEAQERVLIERALKRFRGNRQQAAEALKISPVTLWRKMKRYGLGP